MSINNINNFQIYQQNSTQAFKKFRPNINLSLNKNCNNEEYCENNFKVKAGVLSAATIITFAVMYGISKGKGQNPFKNLNIFKQDYSPMDMLKITGLTVPASLVIGMALDKEENKKPKIKESISQMVGNLIIPICLVDRSIKFKDYIDKKQFTNPVMKVLKGTHKAIYTAVALVSGLMIGNRVANKINSSVFEGHKNRPLKIQDFSAHFDDVCFATSLIFSGNKIGKYASRLIPATLLVSAFETGTKSAKDKD